MDAAALLDGLTAPQRDAVTSDAAPLCILAGAGAGKTRALTRRIAYRVATGTADPGHVLALTFTRKAAGELGERLAALGMRDRVAAGTFHAIAYAQLRRWWADRGQPPPMLLDRKARLLARVVTGRPGLEGVGVGELAAEIEWAQARLVSPAGYERAAAEARRRLPAPAGAIAALYDRYVAEKQRRRLVDFDDLLLRCATAVESDAGFGAAQRWRWRHMFVDEFQDVNPLQYRLLLAWLGSRLDLCVVGDANQAIYEWNGADATLLTGMAERWPATETVRLDANHRCTPQVVDAAIGALGLPAGSITSTRPDGAPVAVRGYPTDDAEAHGVVSEMRRAKASGLAWAHLAILIRTNAQAAAFEAACRTAGVPCQVSGATSILDQPAVRTALAQIGRSPGTPIAAVVADLAELATTGPVPASPSGQAGDRRRELDADQEATLALEALAGLARDFRRLDSAASAAAFAAWLEATVRSDRADRNGPSDSVTICTFHRAKGLEWPAVWVTGLEQGLVPIAHANTPVAHAEERRLLYVALTRAGRELRCSWAQHRSYGGRSVPREPSPWLEGIAGAMVVGGPDDQRHDPDDGPIGTSWPQRFAAERERLAAGGRRHHRLSRSGALSPSTPAGDWAVLDALTVWRAAMARASGVPSHVLLHDVTLKALAVARPSNVEELLAVPGVGPVKASRYGSTLLALVAEHRASA